MARKTSPPKPEPAGLTTVEFEFERETKNKVRFSELGDPDAQVVGKLYVSKAAHESLGWPQKLKLTMEASS